MEMRLYDYIKEIDDIMARAVDENGEVINEELLSQLDELELGKSEKIDNCIKFYKSRKAIAEALKEEKLALAKRQQTAENEANRMKEYLTYCLGGSKWESVAGKISYRKSSVVEIDDLNALEDDYIIYDRTPNKARIREAFENGENVIGAHVAERINALIK